MNIITSSRDAFTMRQKEILDMNREYNNLRQMFPSSLVCGSRPEINVMIVTSTRATESFKTGIDDETDLVPVSKVEK